MDISALLSDPAQKFIRKHQDLNPAELMLSGKSVSGIQLRDLILQIKGRQLAKHKIPSWFKNEKILYGESKALEQCSSEKTAVYKSSLVEGTTLVDLTGGLGVDSSFMGQRFDQVDFVETDSMLCLLAKNNFDALKLESVNICNETAEAYLNRTSTKVDWIYVDPDRRPNQKRTFRITDFTPNIVELMPVIWRHTENLMLKLSPMMDIKQTTDLLHHTAKIHVVSLRNECKELIFILNREFSGEIQYTGVNILKTGDIQSVSFTKSQEERTTCASSSPQNYLYEPNASLMKLGAYKLICDRFNVGKIHPNSHLYTSSKLVKDFHGRTFEIEWTSSYKPKEISKRIESGKANIAVRNFMTDVKSIRSACKLSEGGEDYLFFTTGPDDRPLVIGGKRVSH